MIHKLQDTDVHVWRIWIDAAEAPSNIRVSIEELQRRDRLRSIAKRNTFFTQRLFIRAVLARYMSASMLADGAPFGRNERGKPILIDSEINFNISHSGLGLFIAVCRKNPVGVDFEVIRNMPGMAAIAESFFSPEECAALAASDDQKRQFTFFRIWTRKEALLKAEGVGLACQLKQVSVLPLDLPIARITTPPEFASSATWKIEDLPLPDQFAATVATDGDARISQLYSWGWPSDASAKRWQDVTVADLSTSGPF